MLQKLRYKFIAITMSIVLIMLCIIFGLIYYFTKSNLEMSNISMMQSLAEHPFQLGSPNSSSEDVKLPYFVLCIGEYGGLIATGGGYYDLSDEEFLMDLVAQAISSPEQTDTLEKYHLRFYKTANLWGQIIIFSDISSEQAILRDLTRTCALIGSVSFLILLALSFRLAHWAVKPIDAAWRQQRQFVADASHELKTPLTVIMTNAELLQDADCDGNDRSRFSSAILTMSKQMRSLVEQMLELTRADNVQTAPFSQIDFSRLTADAVLPFEPVFFERGLTLESRIAEHLTVNGNAAQLRQVIDILLDNAQKYSQETGTTRVTLERKGKNHLILSVANDGDEIPADDLKNLFKRFYRADKARGRDGSFGLGLSIAETIVSQHKGKIWAESGMGVNTFFVELRCT